MFNLPSALEHIDISHLTDSQIQLWLKRDDLIHPLISGNKWRKLKYYFQQSEYQSIVSFGGAFSNHLHALAYAGRYFGLTTHAIVRADFIDPDNETIQDCLAQGMSVECVDRQTYRKRGQAEYLAELQARFSNALIIPEGGFGQTGIKGVAELVHEIDIHFSHIICPVGSATTLAGIVSGLGQEQKAIGVAALAQAEYLTAEVKVALENIKPESNVDWQIWCDCHLGGFAKVNDELFDFILDFYKRYQILLDPIYSGKMMLALFNAIKAGYFEPHAKIVAVHTGGLQGWRGFNRRGLLPAGYLETIEYERYYNCLAHQTNRAV